MTRRRNKKLEQLRKPTVREQIYYKHLADEMGFGASVKMLPESFRIIIPKREGIVLSYLPSMVVLEESVAYHVAKDGEQPNDNFQYAKGQLAELGYDLLWVSDEEFPFNEYINSNAH